MQINTKSFRYIFLALTTLMAAIYIYLPTAEAPQTTMRVIASPATTSTPVTVPVSAPASANRHSSSTATQAFRPQMGGNTISPYELSDADFQIFSEWQQSRGYPRVDKQGHYYSNGYEYYSSETLATLAAQGDAQAMRLSAHARMRTADYAAAEAYLIDASVQGYTLSLSELANLKLLQSNNSSLAGNSAQAEQQRQEALAWLEVATKRGDKTINFSKEYYYKKYHPDAAARSAIAQKAASLYEQLSQKRSQLSLDRFDNSYPELLDKLFPASSTSNQSPD